MEFTSPLQLSYCLATDPFPAQASAASGSENKISLTVVATNDTPNTVPISGIIIRIPVGTGATQLTNDPADIGVVKPSATWDLDTKSITGFTDYVFSVKNPVLLAANDSLVFAFNTVAVNRIPGSVTITITEGSNQCNPPDCPKYSLTLPKFPNGWGEVTFTVPPNIPLGGTVKLKWKGPQGATYTIQYFNAQAGQLVNIPAQGASPLSNDGAYPGPNDPDICPDQTTVFTLEVQDTVNEKPYSAQLQQTVTVDIPERLNIYLETSSSSFGVNSALDLTWSTQLADDCIFSVDGGIGQVSIGAANNVRKTCQLNCTDGSILDICNSDGTSIGKITLPSPVPGTLMLRITASKKNAANNVVEASQQLDILPAQITQFSILSEYTGPEQTMINWVTWETEYAYQVMLDDEAAGLSGRRMIKMGTEQKLTAQGFLGPISQDIPGWNPPFPIPPENNR